MLKHKKENPHPPGTSTVTMNQLHSSVAWSIMVIRPVTLALFYNVFLSGRKDCAGFTSSHALLAASSSLRAGTNNGRLPNRGPYNELSRRVTSKLHKASKAAILVSALEIATTALSASGGFGSESIPDPSAYYPEDGSDGNEMNEGPQHEQEGDFPDLSAWALGKEPKGIGTLFERDGEIIRELSSDEYVDIVREWAPLASFPAKEATDLQMKGDAERILNVLRGMAEWQPRRRGDYTKEGSKWAFGAPIGAIKGGQVDAMACLQVSEDKGIVIEWICSNPISLGVPGNAVDWLARGVEALCGKRLGLPVSMSGKATGTRGADSGKGRRDDGGSEAEGGSKKGGTPKKRKK